MTSLRNNEDPVTTADRILAAARESIVAVGWKRTTLTDVAARAGVSRMTVYRTYADMASLLADLMTAEWARIVVDTVEAADPDRPWPDRIARGVAGTVATLREDELFRRMVDVDPEWLLPYLIDRRGRAQDAILAVLVDRLAQAHDEAGIREGDPVLLARSIVLTVHGFLLSAHTMTDRTGTPVSMSDLDDELVDLIRRYLQP